MSEQMPTKLKPEVYYHGPLLITEWIGNDGETTGIFVGRLQQVLNHPRLGKCYDVRTSDIVTWPNKNGDFETRNTRYSRVYQLPMSEVGLSEFNQNG